MGPKLSAIRSNALISNVVDVVFPARCAGCGHRGVWVCDECIDTIARLSPPWCGRCGIPIDSRCRCDELSPAISISRSAAVYSGWVRRAIHLMKYENEPARIPSLAEFMASAARALPPFDALVPAPLHSARNRGRGYNQSEILANELATHLGCQVSRCLVRTRSTRQQVGLDRDARHRNVTGAFAVVPAEKVAGKRLVLVDDVMTTGSTLNACAETLGAAGASWVGTLTLAREI